MNRPVQDRLLRRLRSVTLQGFRGWAREQTIDTDAHVVLLTGANGCGKTSLLEAVNLLANGHFFDLPRDGRPQSEQLNELIFRSHPGFFLRAEVDNDHPEIELRFQEGDEVVQRDDSYWATFQQEPNPPAPELLASATTYFQDRIDFILRDLDRGATLRDFLAPLPLVAERMQRRIRELPDELRRAAKAEEDRLEEEQEPSLAFRAGADGFREAWERLQNLESWLGLPAADKSLASLQDPFAEALSTWSEHSPPSPDELSGLGRLLDAAVERIGRRIAERRTTEVDARLAALSAEADRIRSRLEELERTYPADGAERALAQFAGGELPDLQSILRSIETHLLRWRELAPGLPRTGMLKPLLDELGRLDVGAAGVLRACLEAWLGPWQRADGERRQAQERLREVEGVLGQAKVVAGTAELRRSIEEWRHTWDGETARRRRLAEAERTRVVAAARRRLAKHLQVEEEGKGAFAALQPLDGHVKQELSKALDGTLCRFQFDPGFLPIRPEDRDTPGRDGAKIHGYQLESRDKRPSYVFSTGQKGQVALAYMLAQALLLRQQLPHRVLVLDDTSTAFDLGNIVRQATWLRQLAYCDPPERRWQLFIASHHEELTNRLIELLVPPEGCELRLLRFRSWSPEAGPDVEERKARHNPPLDAELREKLGRGLERAWPTWPARRAEGG
jgi:RecF/RecN/SMC N terminal domain